MSSRTRAGRPDSEVSADVHHLARLIRKQFGLTDLVPRLVRLLAAGEPVTIEQAAVAGGWSVPELRAELAKHPGTDYDDDGRIIGFGLTHRPTPHAFVTDHTVYAFCASDALTFPILLGQPGRIRSTCPVTGRTIEAEATPDRVLRVDPATAVVTRIRPNDAVADLRRDICALGNFFATSKAATDWLDQTPHGQVVPLADDFAVNRLAMLELGWTTG
jgi:alkylmercury lyase